MWIESRGIHPTALSQPSGTGVLARRFGSDTQSVVKLQAGVRDDHSHLVGEHP